MTRIDKHIYLLRIKAMKRFVNQSLCLYSSENKAKLQREFYEALGILRPYFNSPDLFEEKPMEWDTCTKLPKIIKQ